MNRLEWLVAGSLSAVYAVRMLGLFMILPVFALYAQSRPDATPFLAGLAIGIYGLTQAVFQIPLGLMSDRIGRKPVIIGGLAVFALGSIVAALADSMHMIILGRLLQGMGAVAAATMALAADLTREDHRARVMAVIGMTIGVSFMLAMVLGPLINQYAGIAGIFWLTAGLAVGGIVLVAFAVPRPAQIAAHRDAGIVKDYIGKAVANPSLLRMDAGVFVLHLIMTANFLVIPTILKREIHLVQAEHWKIYLPVFVLSFVVAIPLIVIAEKKHKIRNLLLISIAILAVAEASLALGHAHAIPLIAAFLTFFIGFNFLEAVQPSLVAKYSDVSTKGTAMGLYSSAQFFGIFIGGAVGGLVNQQWGSNGVFWFSAGMAMLWLIVAWGLPQPKFYTSQLLKLSPEFLSDSKNLTAQLLLIPGVEEVAIAPETAVAYLKVDKKRLDEDSLRAFSAFE